MRRYSPFYFIGQSISGLWKNGVMSAASILVLMSCLVVMGSFSTLVVNINENMDKLGVLNEIVVFISEEKTEEEISTMYQTVVSFDGVNTVEYISRTDALADQKKEFEEAGYSYLAESLTEENNPLRASFIINYKSDASIEDIQYKLKQIEGIEKINCRADLAEAVNTLKNGVTIILVWFMTTLFVVSIFVIINTIKSAVYARRNEISVMRYIGATKSFITIPFVIEGIVIGIVASIAAYFIQKGMYLYIYDMIGTDYSIISVIPFEKLSLLLLAGFVGLGVITGIIGSCISLRKYLKA